MSRTRGLIERMAQVETEARKLARSGFYENCRSIEMTLVMHGYREAPKVCANPWTQSELDRLCSEARLRRIAPPIVSLAQMPAI